MFRTLGDLIPPLEPLSPPLTGRHTPLPPRGAPPYVSYHRPVIRVASPGSAPLCLPSRAPARARVAALAGCLRTPSMGRFRPALPWTAGAKGWLRGQHEGVRIRCVTTETDPLATAVRIDDLPKTSPEPMPRHPPVGLTSKPAGTQPVTPAVTRALPGFASEARARRGERLLQSLAPEGADSAPTPGAPRRVPGTGASTSPRPLIICSAYGPNRSTTASRVMSASDSTRTT